MFSYYSLYDFPVNSMILKASGSLSPSLGPYFWLKLCGDRLLVMKVRAWFLWRSNSKSAITSSLPNAGRSIPRSSMPTCVRFEIEIPHVGPVC